MDATMYELRKLYDMLGTVAREKFQEQIQTVCVAFFESGNKKPLEVPEFKTEQEYEDYLKLVWSKYKSRLYNDGIKAGREIQQRAIEIAFGDRRAVKQLYRSDINLVLDYLRTKVPHDP